MKELPLNPMDAVFTRQLPRRIVNTVFKPLRILVGIAPIVPPKKFTVNVTQQEAKSYSRQWGEHYRIKSESNRKCLIHPFLFLYMTKLFLRLTGAPYFLYRRNGARYLKSEAKISVFDHGLLYGDGIFEGIRPYDARAFQV